MIDNSGIAADAIQLANDRPTSNNDDLYLWAVDAEETLREQAKVIELMRSAASKFVRKVHNGHAKSVETYDDMQEILTAIRKLEGVE